LTVFHLVAKDGQSLRLAVGAGVDSAHQRVIFTRSQTPSQTVKGNRDQRADLLAREDLLDAKVRRDAKAAVGELVDGRIFRRIGRHLVGLGLIGRRGRHAAAAWRRAVPTRMIPQSPIVLVQSFGSVVVVPSNEYQLDGLSILAT